MDNATIRKQNIVERYVQGTLTGDELTEFEIYMLDHPEVVDDIEYEQGMQDALRNTRDKLPANTHSGKSMFFRSTEYAMAATVLLVVTLAFSAFQFRELEILRDRAAEQVNPIAVAGDIWLEPMRGDRVWVVENPPGSTAMVRADVSATPASSYTVILSGEATSWTKSGIEPDTEQSIRLVLSGLPAGEYEMTISADAPDSPAAPFARYRLLLR